MSKRRMVAYGCALLVAVVPRGAVAGFPLEPGEAVVTCRSFEFPPLPSSPYVVAVFDVRDPGCDPQAVPGENWPLAGYHNEMPNPTGNPADEWTIANLGEVFGIALDDRIPPSIYVASTSTYIMSSGSGRVFRLDGTTGAVSVFADLPNSGPGLGNIAFDAVHGQFLVTNLEDGAIYRLDRSGTVLERFDPFLADAGDPGFAPLGERPWGVGVHENRVYFGVWSEDSGRAGLDVANTVWSVGLDPATGAFATAALTLEVSLPPATIVAVPYSNPVSDIAFSAEGRMMLAERTMRNDEDPSAHEARLLEYEGGHLAWTLSPRTFSVGEIDNAGFGRANASGGVAYDCAEADQCNAGPHVWATGDGLRYPTPKVYGIQGLPADGGTYTDSYLVDLDGLDESFVKSSVGDVELHRACPQSCPEPAPSAVPEAIPPACAGEAVRLDGSGSSGCGGLGLQYRWLDGAAVLCDWSADPVCDLVPPPGLHVYTLEVRCLGRPDCAAAHVITVEVAPVPDPSLDLPPRICAGGEVLLDASGSSANGCSAPLEYRFLAGTDLLRDWSVVPVHGPLQPDPSTTYRVEARCLGCVAAATGAVEVAPQAEAAAGPDAAVCQFEGVRLDASASAAPGCATGLLYEWREGATLVRAAGPDPTFAPPTDVVGTRSYTVSVWCPSAPECAAADPVAVTVNPCALAVHFDRFEALRRPGGGGVEVRWRTALEQDTLGFRVRRAASPSGPFADVGRVAARGPGFAYALADGLAGAAPAWYEIVEMTGNGAGDRTPPFAAAEAARGTGGGARQRRRGR